MVANQHFLLLVIERLFLERQMVTQLQQQETSPRFGIFLFSFFLLLVFGENSFIFV